MFIEFTDKCGQEVYVNTNHIVRIVINDRETLISLLSGDTVELLGADNETIKEVIKNL